MVHRAVRLNPGLVTSRTLIVTNARGWRSVRHEADPSVSDMDRCARARRPEITIWMRVRRVIASGGASLLNSRARSTARRIRILARSSGSRSCVNVNPELSKQGQREPN